MTTYRHAWQVLVVLVGAVSVFAAGTVTGWVTTIVTTSAFALLGAMFGFSWVEDPRRRRRAVTRGAVWFAIGTVLVLGLPVVLGAWSILVLLLLAVGSPDLLGLAARALRSVSPGPAAEPPQRLSDRDLERRWKRTTDQVQGRSLSPAARLRLVEERSMLLDELERRDPRQFERWLVRAGWHEPRSGGARP